MPWIRVKGLKIAYISSEDLSSANPAVLYIHGSGDSYHCWLQQVKAEVAGYNHIALDLPGHARSEGSGADTVEEYRDFVHEFLSACGLNKAVLAGHSLGGAVVQSFALAYPDLLKSIILVGTGARLRVAGHILEGAKQGESLAIYAYSSKTSQELIAEAETEFNLTDPAVRYADLLACDKFDIMQKVSGIKVRSMIICGEDDLLTPVKYARFLQDKIKGSRLEVIPDAGHKVMWEKPEEFNRILDDFLQGKI